MPSTTLVPVSEYLANRYRPDREYIDGELLERNVGEWDHSRLQTLLLKLLLPYEDSAGLLTAPEQRVQVKPSRFRVPDLCVVNGDPGEQVLTRPPLICIEVLSPDDSMSSMQERIEDYLAFGVPHVWILDPRRKKAYWADGNGVHEAGEMLAASGTPMRVSLKLLWP
jgi:Uma2 family endonuclease